MKTRFVFSALCMLVAMTMATGAIAQTSRTFQASASATVGRMNGHTERAGGITLAPTSTVGTAADGTVVIDYGLTITNTVNITADVTDDATDIEVTLCGDDLSADNAVIDGGTLTLIVGEGAAAGCENDNDVIDVSGVRLSLVGSGRSSVDATVTSDGDIRLIGGTATLTVMNSIVDELTDDGIDVDTKVSLIRHTGKPDNGGQFKLLIMENTVLSFDGAQINLEFSGIPDEVEVTIDAWVAKASDLEDDDFPGVDQATNFNPNQNADPPEVADAMSDQLPINKEGNLIAVITAEENEAKVLTTAAKLVNDDDTTVDEATFVSGMLTNERDVIIVLGTIDGADEDDLLPLALDIQVTVDVGPIGVAKPKGDQTDTIPRFASDKSTPMTVIESTSAQTMFLVPYAVYDGSMGGYDTGFSIANATSGKTAQIGTVTFSFPGDATLEAFESAMVGPGQNLTLLLSEIIGAGTIYTGQVKIIANWTEAEGVAFVSNFLTFTSASPLVNLDDD